MHQLPVALQMYTVRDDADRDFGGTVARVAEIGYRAVELAGFGGRTAAAASASSTTPGSPWPAPTSRWTPWRTISGA
jgi:hypothetical protein